MSGFVPTNNITPGGLVSVQSSPIPCPCPRPHASKVSIPPIVLGSLTFPRCCSLPVPETLKGHATQRGAGRAGPLGLPHDRGERLQPGPDHLQGEWPEKGWASFLLFCSLRALNCLAWVVLKCWWSRSRCLFYRVYSRTGVCGVCGVCTCAAANARGLDTNSSLHHWLNFRHKNSEHTGGDRKESNPGG